MKSDNERIRKEMKKKKTGRINSLSPVANVIMNILMAILALLAIIPFIFVVIISFTDESWLASNGYSFFPKQWSVAAYQYIFAQRKLIFSSFGVSVFLVIVGTLLSLVIIAMYAYILFRKDYKFRSFFNWMSFITMIFGAGMVPTYVIITQVLGLKDNLLAVILPVICNPFNIIILKTFYTTSIPESLIESAQIDGSNEFNTFFKIVTPLALPGLATVGLFYALAYWNDWFNAMLYLDNSKFIPLQYLLMKIQNNITYLTTNADALAGNAEAIRSTPSESARMVLVVIIVVPIAFAYPFFQKYFISGLTIGAVKG